ncbi:MAG: membrane or secreted protein [Bacteroidetes bacterium]|nr:membrane or secreted protein [Bacteroidota bacterium]
MIFKLIILAIVIVGVAFSGIAVKMFLQRGGKFTKSCSSVDPSTGMKRPCTCGGQSEENCDNAPLD